MKRMREALLKHRLYVLTFLSGICLGWGIYRGLGSLIVVSGAALLLLVAGVALPRLHRHQWVNRSVLHGEYVIAPGPATVILQSCECGQHRTTTLNGHWPARLFTPPATSKGE